MNAAKRIACFALGSLGSMGASWAQEAPAPPVTEGNIGQTASWRERYELGPGDTLNFAFYGRPELDRKGTRIAPDGTVSYLQAQNVLVAGLSIDEARIALEEELKGVFKYPRLILTPGEIQSKRYIVLGKVMSRGVFPLDRPLTLVEAIAESDGFEVGLLDENTVELADMDRSFISRKGERLPIDFRALFLEGDMTQNVELEPNDYIYIADGVSSAYYVFGAVTLPGLQFFTPGATIVTALTRRSSYTDDAYLDRVLVVRGSLQKPETIVVDVGEILKGKQPDFPLEPQDIVYVSERPWRRVERLTDIAIRSFLTSATTSWININVDDIITSPIIGGADLTR
ncbi:MAG: polysaccharide biosynthesis/export family protein [Verrucomicrobiota bacterium]